MQKELSSGGELSLSSGAELSLSSGGELSQSSPERAELRQDGWGSRGELCHMLPAQGESLLTWERLLALRAC